MLEPMQKKKKKKKKVIRLYNTPTLEFLLGREHMSSPMN